MESSQFATGGVERWQFGYLAPCLSFFWSSEKDSVADYLSYASFFLMGPLQQAFRVLPPQIHGCP